MPTTTTFNHSEIRRWAEAHGGVPQLIDDPHANGDVQGLRIAFPDARDVPVSPRLLQRVDWETFFAHFEELQYAVEFEDPIDGETPLAESYRFLKRGVL